MPPSTIGPPFDRFLATAEEVAQARPEVDLEMAREVFHEVATLLYNGLALDGLDDHDTGESPGDLHDPEGASAAYLVAASILQL
jgi:hypothetical protein